jgi:outer membrane receptor protein involved in Fe transport
VYGQGGTNAAVELRPVIVTGTTIQSEDAAGTLTVGVLSPAELVNVGQPTLADTARTRLTQYAGGTGALNPGFGNGGDGSSTISLRGLPANATLMLVNGRRTATSDLNLIPEAAIERIEILQDGAGAIYGSDAVAGVVNIILKDSYNGVKLGTYYGNTTDSDVSQYKASALVGTATEKSRLVVSLEYDKANELMTRDRERSINTPVQVSSTSNPGLFTVAVSSLAGNEISLRWHLDPLYSRGLTNAAQIPAGFDPNARALVPEGLSASAARAAREAELNALLPPDSPVRYGPNPQLPNPLGIAYDPGFPFPYYTTGYRPHERYVGYFSGGHQLYGENLEFFANGYYAFNNSRLELAPSPLGLTVPAGNYWYRTLFPAAAEAGTLTPLSMRYRTVELGPRITYTDFQSARAVAGLNGRIADSAWRWETAFTYDRTQIDEKQTGGVIYDNVNAALAAGDPSAFNPFGYTPIFGTSAVNSEAVLGNLTGDAYTKQVVSLLSWDAKVNGDIFKLPGGMVAGSVGTEYRREQTDYAPDYAVQQGLIGPYNVIQSLRAVRDSMAGFGELLVPVFGEDLTFPALKSFTASGALRYEDYSDVGDTGVKPRVSFRWEPIDEQIAIRGSWAQGFIAPGFFDLYQEPSQDFVEVYNPLTGEREQPEHAVLTIGNRGLKPTESETWMIGTVIEPKALKGFSFSADYYRIEQTGIPFSSAQYIVNQWAAAGGVGNPANPFAANVGPSSQNPLGAQVEADADNHISQIRNVGPINTGTRFTDGIDAMVSKKFETGAGTFTLTGQATRVLTFKQENFPGAGSVRYLGRFFGPGAVLDNTGFPEWRANITLQYKYERFTAAAAWNYVGGYKEDTTATDDFSDENAANLRDVHSYQTADLRVGYKIPWVEAEVVFGVNNITDEQPPLVISSFENAYDRRVADLRGRMYFVMLTKEF